MEIAHECAKVIAEIFLWQMNYTNEYLKNMKCMSHYHIDWARQYCKGKFLAF